MTPQELLHAAERATEQGHEFVQLTVRRAREPRYWDAARLWRGGPKCRFVAWIEGQRYLVEVKVSALKTAVERLVSP